MRPQSGAIVGPLQSLVEQSVDCLRDLDDLSWSVWEPASTESIALTRPFQNLVQINERAYESLLESDDDEDTE
jgi:hypothetical protein